MEKQNFLELLKAKKEELDYELLAKMLHAEIADTIKSKRKVSSKFLLASQELKPMQFRRLCKLIPINYSTARRHVKVAQFLNRKGMSEKFGHIESWDVLHSISLLSDIELKHFILEMVDGGIEFNKSDVESYRADRSVRKIRSGIYSKWKAMSSIQIYPDPNSDEAAFEEMKRLLEFAGRLPLVCVDDFLTFRENYHGNYYDYAKKEMREELGKATKYANFCSSMSEESEKHKAASLSQNNLVTELARELNELEQEEKTRKIEARKSNYVAPCSMNFWHNRFLKTTKNNGLTMLINAK
jgi:hypothetical protein